MGHKKKERQRVFCLRETSTFHDQPSVAIPVPFPTPKRQKRLSLSGSSEQCRTGPTLRPVQAMFLNCRCVTVISTRLSTFTTIKSRETSFSCNTCYSCLSMSQFATVCISNPLSQHKSHNTQHTTHNTQHTTHNTHLASPIPHLTSHISTTQPHNILCTHRTQWRKSSRHYLVLCLRSMDIAIVVRAKPTARDALNRIKKGDQPRSRMSWPLPAAEQ